MEQGTRLFNRSHEWIEAVGENLYRLGISDYAQHSMGDIVFVDLPSEDDDVVAGEAFAECESVKAVSEIFSPINGTVVAVNEALDDNPAAVNEDPYEAWLVEVESDEAVEEAELLTEDDYEAYIQTLD